ncbi:SusC/RagA family TonB-linked outer membrane protein [Marinigracilibium pacificum]|uniref:TonB-dependent receptor n=1 Tax=Marinigracilibium pacificum TaxID=2729599 RepID=A0A848J1D8_9BACT|nr:TonB-dependent receptor [Marinigracilibium pacificum]NMM48360.1 TonB-dependent receptor [Marinigracilibium pacificum]
MKKSFTLTIKLIVFGLFFNLTTLAQQTITGVVKDEEGQTLPGATVSVKGTTRGGVTEYNGTFSIEVDKGETLVFSVIGFTKQEVVIENQSYLEISLVTDISLLDEVVVVGYGTQTKSNVSGAITSIDQEALAGRPVADFQSALQGQVAGLNITNSSGAPGGNTTVRIRGTGSITGGSSPLYVIDGNIIQTGVGGAGDPFATINASDIESISVLKDASAAALYGARGANGVIIITTKKGKSGAPQINFNTFVGFQEVTKKLDMLNGAQYQSVYNTVQDNAGRPRYSNLDTSETLPTATDWQDEIFQNGLIQNYDLSVRGGGQNTTYYASVNRYSEEGTVLGTGFDRTSIRVNTETNLKRFSFGNTLNVSRANYDKEYNANGRGPVAWALSNSPLVEVRDPNNLGGFNGPTDADGNNRVLNPVASQTLIDNESTVDRVFGNLYAEYEFFDGFSFRVNAGFDVTNYDNYIFEPLYDLGNGELPVGSSGEPQATETRGESLSGLLENTLNYRRTFGKHNLDLLAGYTVQHVENSRLSLVTSGQNVSPNFPITGGSNNVVSLGSSYVEKRTESYLGRIIYDYDAKYLATFNYRRDGSSVFTRDNFYDDFLSGSLGWVISNESFMEDATLISNLKLRGSYGFLGNDQIDNNATVSTLDINPRYVLGGANPQTVVVGVGPGSQVANPNLVWEKQEQLNLGLDFGLFEGKWNTSIDYYVKTSQDLLLNFPLPQTTGVSTIFINAGEVENRGIEITTSYNNQFGELDFFASFNIAFNDNEVTKLADGLEAIERFASNELSNQTKNRIQPGHSLFAFYGFVADGIYQSQEEIDNGPTPFPGNTAPGDIRYKDISGPDGVPDGIIDENDRTFIGDANQDITLGFSFNLGYRNFDFSAQFQGVYGVDIFSETKFFTQGYFLTNNMTTDVLNAWTPENNSNTHPRAIPADISNNDLVSSYYIEDGSYLRLKNLQVGYSIPVSSMDNFNVFKSARIYFAGQNLLTFTNYSGYDPEIGLNGIDRVGYPPSRRYTLGVQLGF